MGAGENRFAEKKRKTHEQILKAAERLIENEGLEALCLDRIAETADISRATLFNHVHTRDELLVEVLSPLFDDCIAMLERLPDACGTVSVESIADACVYMWNTHKGAIFRPDCVRPISGIPILRTKHDRMASLFVSLFDSLPAGLALRLSSPRDTALLVLRTFIPILETLSGEKNFIGEFRECLSALMLKRPC